MVDGRSRNPLYYYYYYYYLKESREGFSREEGEGHSM